MKVYHKIKSGHGLSSPKYRTPDNFRSRTFGKRSKEFLGKFNPSRFKIQHKG